MHGPCGRAEAERCLIDGHPLESVRTATTVLMRDGRVSVTDGPFAETKEQLAGSYMIDVANLDEAIKVAATIPSARVGSIEVRPIDLSGNWNPEYRTGQVDGKPSRGPRK